MAGRTRYDLKQAGTKELVDRIVHGAFLAEGSMVAFPLCFPGVTIPYPPDESRVHALAVAPGGAVYGIAGGRQAHLFCALFHGATGCVLDLGEAAGAERGVAAACLAGGWVAATDGPAGSRLWGSDYTPLPFDLLQEWTFYMRPVRDLGTPWPGERIRDLVPVCDGTALAVATDGHVLALSRHGSLRAAAEVDAPGRLFVLPDGRIAGIERAERLFVFDPVTGHVVREPARAPGGSWASASGWAGGRGGQPGYIADGEGWIHVLDSAAGLRRIARAPLAPVNTMVLAPDGRLFGHSGDGIGRFFRLSPGAGETVDLGVAVSVFERRRYGYQFASSAVGRDGQLFFGEDDDLGHLWIYFPRLDGC